MLTLDPPKPNRYYGVECSSYQIDLAPSLAPDVGILLNLSPDHLDRHGTMEHYSSVKERLVAQCDHAVISVDDEYCAAIEARLRHAGHKVLPVFTTRQIDDGYFGRGDEIIRARDGKLEVIASVQRIGSLRGAHNLQNALAAAAACQLVGLSAEEIQAGLSTFPGLAHRMEQVGQIGQVLFINDSKATNVEAAATALASFDKIYWIAGGLEKDGGFGALKPYLNRIAKAYLVGEAAPALSSFLSETVRYEISGTIEQAVNHAADDAAHDISGESVVLLSPACASFDQFRNFEIRGDAFRAAVMALEGFEPIGGNI